MKREIFEKADGYLRDILRISTIVCLVGLWIFISAGVFVRFFPITSMGWADEIIELGFAWMVFLGASALWRDRSHFRVELFPQWLAGTKAGRILEIFLSFMAFLFLLMFTYEGGLLTIRATDRSPILEITRTFFYMVMPISGAIMIGYTMRDLWSFFRGKSSNK